MPFRRRSAVAESGLSVNVPPPSSSRISSRRNHSRTSQSRFQRFRTFLNNLSPRPALPTIPTRPPARRSAFPYQPFGYENRYETSNLPYGDSTWVVPILTSPSHHSRESSTTASAPPPYSEAPHDTLRFYYVY